MTSSDVECDARIARAHIVEPGDALANELIHAMGAAEAFAAVLDPMQRLSLAASRSKPFAENEVNHNRAVTLERRAARHHQLNAGTAPPVDTQVVVPSDEHWPTQLDDLGTARPIALWVRVDASPLATRSIAIVGARSCTSFGEHVTMTLAEDVAHAGITVGSGAAVSVDGAAHRAALAVGVRRLRSWPQEWRGRTQAGTASSSSGSP